MLNLGLSSLHAGCQDPGPSDNISIALTLPLVQLLLDQIDVLLGLELVFCFP